MRKVLREGSAYALVLLLCAGFTVAARVRHFVEGRRLASSESRLRDEVGALEDAVRRLEMRLSALDEGDPFAIEREIRQRFGFLRPNEVAVAAPAVQDNP